MNNIGIVKLNRHGYRLMANRLKRLTPAIIVLVAMLTLGGCKLFRGTKLEKAYHNTTTHYNPYFNARELVKKVDNLVFDNYENDYTLVLLPMTTTSEKTVKSYTTDIEDVNKKCSKALAKHPVSNWVDDCYLLVARAYFLKRDYFAALESYNYLIDKYKGLETGLEAQIWAVRCLVEMNKLEDASHLLKTIKAKDPLMTKRLEQELNLVKAQRLIKLGTKEAYKEAIPLMEKVLKRSNVRKYNYRYKFILAQLYEETGQNTKAAKYYRKVARSNAAYDLAFQAKLKYTVVSGKEKQIMRVLNRMLKDEKNANLLDQIYFAMAKAQLKAGKKDEAMESLKNSARYSLSNKTQKARSYKLLGELYFEKPVYPLAKAYNDSAMANMDTEFPGYNAFKARQEILSDLIKQLVIIQQEDSLLRLSEMDTASLRKFVVKMIDDEKKKQAELEKKDQFAPLPGGSAVAPPSFLESLDKGTGKYFYNATALRQGASEFRNIWGPRANQDNWRMDRTTIAEAAARNTRPGDASDTKDSSDTEPKDTKTTLAAADNTPASLQKYYQYIPKTQSEKRLKLKNLEGAYYALGLIYFNNLKDYPKSIETFLIQLDRFPSGTNASAAAYNLYLLYKEVKDSAKAEQYKNFVISKYPNSVYRNLIDDPDALVGMNSNADYNEALEKSYLSIYESYRDSNYARVVQLVKETRNLYEKNYYLDKYDYLGHLAQYQIDKKYAMVDSLKSFMAKHSKSPLAVDAKIQIDYLTQLALNRPSTNPARDSALALAKDSAKAKKSAMEVAAEKFKPDNALAHFFVVFIPMSANSNVLRTELSNYNIDNIEKKLRIDGALINNETQVVYVSGFDNADEAIRYLKDLDKRPGFYSNMALPSYKRAVISTVNFGTLMREKNSDAFLTFFQKYYAL